MAIADDVALLQTQVAALQQTTVPPTEKMCRAEIAAIESGRQDGIARSTTERAYMNARLTLLHARLDELAAARVATDGS